MTKLDNDGQVVKKEIFKLTLEYPKRLDTTNLSHDAIILINELAFLVALGRIGKNQGKQVKNENLIEFKYFLPHHVARATDCVFTIDSIRKSVQELLSKRYLFRDTDGTLAFTQGGAA